MYVCMYVHIYDAYMCAHMYVFLRAWVPHSVQVVIRWHLRLGIMRFLINCIPFCEFATASLLGKKMSRSGLWITFEASITTSARFLTSIVSVSCVWEWHTKLQKANVEKKMILDFIVMLFYHKTTTTLTLWQANLKHFII